MNCSDVSVMTRSNYVQFSVLVLYHQPVKKKQKTASLPKMAVG